MDNYKSTKPKPAWVIAAQRASTEYENKPFSERPEGAPNDANGQIRQDILDKRANETAHPVRATVDLLREAANVVGIRPSLKMRKQ